MKKSYWFVIIWLSILIIFWSNKAIQAQNSNILVNVTLTPQQYSNLNVVANNQGLSITQFLSLTNMNIAAEFRQQAIVNRVKNALDKFRTLSDAQKDQVLDLIESF